MGTCSKIVIGELLLCLSIQIWMNTEASLGSMTGEVNERIVIPCKNQKSNTSGTSWFKDNFNQALLSCGSDKSTDERFLRENSSLVISSIKIPDEGGPHNISANIFPTKILPNGTLYISWGANLTFNCSCQSYPEPKMTWTLYGLQNTKELFHQNYASVINFNITHLASNFQGNYSCSSENPVSGRKVSSTMELLVYHPPSSPMVCYANNSDDLLQLVLSCTWPGGYPSPDLQWIQDDKALKNQTGISDTLVLSLNSTQLSAGQQFECQGKHLTNDQKKEKCQLQTALPVLESQPLRTCLLGGNVTLSCTASGATPLAVITWLRNWSNPDMELQSGKKYYIFQSNTTSFLTISNCSNDGDEGYYVCKAENALGMKEINVYLTVTKPRKILGLVFAILILVLLVVALITGIIFYCDPQLYLKAHFFRSSGTEVMVLVDEEEEEELEDMREPTESTLNTETERPPAVNGNIYKHEALFHHPPDNISPALFGDISEDIEVGNPSDNL
ncbi:V-set and immunoglobulin domain-containing 10 isoform X1 [Pelobates cultripes]|nr:V-set and immunoglobulin domain-containing 10 isoform X1 [Pelobates cultripes]